MGMTKQRMAILDIVQQYDGGHPTVEDIYAIAKERFPNIGMGTVYRNLNILSETGAIKRVQISNDPVRYDRTLAPHEHMICVKCGRIDDIPPVKLDTEELVPSNVKILRYSLVLYCLCPDCLKQFKRLP